MRAPLRFAIGCLLAGSLTARGEAPEGADAKVTKKNWEHHPKVEGARGVYAEVRTNLDSGRFKQRELKDCTPFVTFSSRFLTVATDGLGVVRYLRREMMSTDAAQTREYYYDPEGHLRFVLATVSNGGGTLRVWLDERAAIVWTKRDTDHGGSDYEGPTYYLKDPETVLVRDPKSLLAGAVDSSTDCPNEPDFGSGGDHSP
jgi:hypothetical protein